VFEFGLATQGIDYRIDERTDAGVRSVAIAPVYGQKNGSARDFATRRKPCDETPPPRCNPNEGTPSQPEPKRIGWVHVDEGFGPM
jgi:hypothetical protein